MEPIITVNQYPIGWEWLDRVPLEDFNWLIEIFSTMTDNTDTYDFVGYTDSETLPGHQKICSVDKIPLANFLNEDQGYKSGISMYGHYIACKCLDISSEREYMNQYTYLRYPNQEINNNHLHSEHIRLQIREMLQIPLSDITIIDIILLP
jgi:hypothetical protein